MRAVLPFTAWLAGCAGPGLSPAVTVSDDPMLAALPADVRLVAGGELAALRDAPLVRELLGRVGIDADAVDAAIAEAGGPAGGASALARVRVGCGDAGCAALLEGDFAGSRVADAVRVGKRAGGAVRVAPGRVPGVDLRGTRGQRFAFRLLSDHKAILGDRAAVRAVRKARGGGLDVTPLVDAIPAGDVWIVAWDLDRLEAQAAKRAERGAAGAGERLRAGLARRVEKAPVHREDIDTVALSVSVGADAEARLRVRCADETAAITLAAALEAAPVDGVDVAVARDGVRVEAVGAIDAETALALLGAG